MTCQIIPSFSSESAKICLNRNKLAYIEHATNVKMPGLHVRLGLLVFMNIVYECSGQNLIVPYLNGKCYVGLQDINIGFLFHISERGETESQHCSSNIVREGAAETVEFLKYVIREINRNSTILPNISLGYVFADSCDRDLVSLARALYYIPRNNQSNVQQSKAPFVEECGNQVHSYPVSGVLGYLRSADAVLVAPLLSVAQIPFLAPVVSSDDLSDRTRFEYLIRMVLPDRYQVKAMMDFAQHYNFTYISLLYADGSYGLNAAKYINIEAKHRGICIAYRKQISSLDTKEDYNQVVKNLVRNLEARVVILFLRDYGYKMLFAALKRQNIFNYFILLASDSLGYYKLGKFENGCFFTLPKTQDMASQFREMYNQITPDRARENPWIFSQWERYYDCKWFTKDSNKSCQQFANKSHTDLPPYVYLNSNIFHDALWVYAFALDTLIRDRCPEAFVNTAILDKCIQGQHLLSYMKNVSFEGVSGPVKFNANGDKLDSYNIIQYEYNDGEHSFNIIGTWNSDGETLALYEDKIRWDLFRTKMKESEMSTSGERHAKRSLMS